LAQGGIHFRRAISIQPWAPIKRWRLMGTADDDVKSILETLAADCGAVLR